MGLLYFFETTVEYRGMGQKEFYKLWAKHGAEASALFQKGIIKHAFKVKTAINTAEQAPATQGCIEQRCHAVLNVCAKMALRGKSM